jgi:hypothetical protein
MRANPIDLTSTTLVATQRNVATDETQRGHRPQLKNDKKMGDKKIAGPAWENECAPERIPSICRQFIRLNRGVH